MKDYIIRAIDKDKSIRVFVANTTNMVNKARQIHNTTATTTAALGRLLTASSIMGVMLKEDNSKITLQIKSDGPVKSILAVANSKGIVKGYIQNPNVELPLRSDGKLNVGGAVGTEGKLVVIKDLGLKEPYIGQSNLVSGEIAEDIAQYFAISEQQPSAVALGVLVGKDFTVKSAGGFIVQVLPDISEENLTKLEGKIKSFNSVSRLIDEGNNLEDILYNLFGDFDIQIIDKTEVKLECDCSKERMEQALILLGEEEINKIIEEDEGAEISCRFCNTKYCFNKDELSKLLEYIKE